MQEASFCAHYCSTHCDQYKDSLVVKKCAHLVGKLGQSVL